MALMGSLGDIKLADLIQTIANNRKSGILFIKSEVGIGQIYFYEGAIFQALSPLRGERLGEHLMKKGIITHKQLEEALNHQEERGRELRIGGILHEMGLISKDSNLKSLREITEEAFYDLLTWSVGFYRFDQKASLKNIEITLDAFELLHEGNRRIIESNKENFDKKILSVYDKLMKVYGQDVESIIHDLDILLSNDNVNIAETGNEAVDIDLKSILNEFQQIQNVKMVLIAGKNGSFLDCAGEPDDVHFSLSAMVGNSWGLLETIAIKLNASDKLNQSITTFQDNCLFIKKISEEWMLIIIGATDLFIKNIIITFQKYRNNLVTAVNSIENL